MPQRLTLGNVVTTPLAGPVEATSAATGENGVETPPAKAKTSTATFISETALTFTLANTGGVAILTVFGLLGDQITPQLVAGVGVTLGAIVVILGLPWVKPTGPEKGKAGEYAKGIVQSIVIGVLNTALLIVALWGSVTAIRAGL